MYSSTRGASEKLEDGDFRWIERDGIQYLAYPFGVSDVFFQSCGHRLGIMKCFERDLSSVRCNLELGPTLQALGANGKPGSPHSRLLDAEAIRERREEAMDGD